MRRLIVGPFLLALVIPYSFASSGLVSEASVSWLILTGSDALAWNRVTQILLKNSSNTTLRTQSWTYDNASNVATMTQGGVLTTFGYDDIDQLTSESRTAYSASYSYDANGNRLTRTIGSTTENYTYDDADKLDYIQVGGSTTKDYSYDTAGRTTSVVSGGNTTSLTYDYENRVTQITYPNSSTNSFTYNGLDTRVSKVDSGGTKAYLRDGVGVTAPVLNDAAASYTPGISERRSSATTYYHGGIKNAESQTNTSQSVTATKTFDAFGNVDTSSGTWKGPFAYGGPFGYQSDSDSGLMLLGHRYYDSSIGRFLTRDKAKDTDNWYSYVANNPLIRVDPVGQSMQYYALAVAKDLDDSSISLGNDMANFGLPFVQGQPLHDYYLDLFDLPEGGTKNQNNDCGVFVAFCAQVVDPDFPDRGTGKQHTYLNSPAGKLRWARIDAGDDFVPRPGDIFNKPPPPGKKYGHTELVGPGGDNMGASYGDHPPTDHGAPRPFGNVYRPLPYRKN